MLIVVHHGPEIFAEAISIGRFGCGTPVFWAGRPTAFWISFLWEVKHHGKMYFGCVHHNDAEARVFPLFEKNEKMH